MRRIKAAGDTYDHLFDPRRQQPGLKPTHLDVVDLLATLVAPYRIGGHVGEAFDVPSERRLGGVHAELERDRPHPRQASPVVVNVVAEAAQTSPVLQYPIQVDVRQDELLLV